MSSSVVVLRAFSGMVPGQVIDTSEWRHTKSLEEDRYVKTLDTAEVGDQRECECGVNYLPAARLHDCAVLQAARDKRVAEAAAAKSAAATPVPTPAAASVAAAPALTVPATTLSKTPARSA